MNCPRCNLPPIVQPDSAGFKALAFAVWCPHCGEKAQLCGRGITTEAAIAQWNDKTSRAVQS